MFSSAGPTPVSSVDRCWPVKGGAPITTNGHTGGGNKWATQQDNRSHELSMPAVALLVRGDRLQKDSHSGKRRNNPVCDEYRALEVI